MLMIGLGWVMEHEEEKNKLDGDGRTILVVEDSRSLQRLCKVFLHKHNYRVLQALSGDEALVLVEQESPRLPL